MKRRDFVGTGVLAGVGLTLGSSRARAAPPAGPAPGTASIISTWDFGLPANREAQRVLAAGGSPLDAAESGVMVCERDPANTSVGYGGLPNSEGHVELDAAIMDGNSLDAGSVAALRHHMHPVAVARRVMEVTPHVLLVGAGAGRFARAQGFKRRKLLTAEARRWWKEQRHEAREVSAADHDTVGMVVRDERGRMAAACTTSGLGGKLPGRVGDSPLVGHGLYCDAEAGGAAATGIGEEVIKVCGSYQVVEFMRQGLEPDEAIRRVLERVLRRDSRNRTRQVAFIALRADGAFGCGSTVEGFEAAVLRGGSHVLVPGRTAAGVR